MGNGVGEGCWGLALYSWFMVSRRKGKARLKRGRVGMRKSRAYGVGGK